MMMSKKFQVRTVYYDWPGASRPINVLYLSDLHFNRWSENYGKRIIASVCTEKPSIILLGGDYVDERKGLAFFEELVIACSSCCSTYAIAGNHDVFFGLAEIQGIIEKQGGIWLENKSISVTVAETILTLHGNVVNKPVTTIESLQVAVLHEPRSFDHLTNEYDLAFAGHLHGCQFVLWEQDKSLYPGKIFYPNNFIESETSDLTYLISRGLGDTLPLRYNCPYEYLKVVVQPSSSTNNTTFSQLTVSPQFNFSQAY